MLALLPVQSSQSFLQIFLFKIFSTDLLVQFSNSISQFTQMAVLMLIFSYLFLFSFVPLITGGDPYYQFLQLVLQNPTSLDRAANIPYFTVHGVWPTNSTKIKGSTYSIYIPIQNCPINPPFRFSMVCSFFFIYFLFPFLFLLICFSFPLCIISHQFFFLLNSFQHQTLKTLSIYFG